MGVFERCLIKVGQVRVAMHGQVVTHTVHFMVLLSITVMLFTVVAFNSVHGNAISLRVKHLVVVVGCGGHVSRRGGGVNRHGAVMGVGHMVFRRLVMNIVADMTAMVEISVVVGMCKLFLKWAHMVRNVVFMVQVMLLPAVRVLLTTMVEVFIAVSVRIFVPVGMVRLLMHVSVVCFVVRLMVVVVASVLRFVHVLVVVRRFSLHGEHLCWVIMLAVMQSLRHIWLHLQH